MTWGCFKIVLESFNVAQKLILKIALGKCGRYLALFDETFILTISQIYIESVLLLAVCTNFFNIFQNISHNTRYSYRIGITSMHLNT